MYQTVILVGNLGRDPEMRYTPSGQAVTSFSVATNRQYTNNNGETVKENHLVPRLGLGQDRRDLQPVSQERLQGAGGRPPDGRSCHRRPAHLDRTGWLTTCLLRSQRPDRALPEFTRRYRRTAAWVAHPARMKAMAPAGDEGDIPF